MVCPAELLYRVLWRQVVKKLRHFGPIKLGPKCPRSEMSGYRGNSYTLQQEHAIHDDDDTFLHVPRFPGYFSVQNFGFSGKRQR